MVIDGIIILEASGRPIVQTNFRSKGPAYPLLHIDAFNNALSETQYANLDPVLSVAAHHGPSACCHMECGGLRFLCPVSGDVDPLFAFSFLQTLVEVLHDYVNDISPTSLRDHFDVVYQLLEEMLDNGHPLTTERNTLRDIVLPPSLWSKVLAVAGAPDFSKTSANPFASPLPWRKLGVKYANNEIYFDINESMTAIVNKNGTVLSSQVWGEIDTNCHLSGMPDLLLTFRDTKSLQDCSFHPCVRLQKWSKDKMLSFVPPDGSFVLMEFRYSPVVSGVVSAPRPIPLPFTLTPSITLSENGGVIDLTLTSRLSARVIERIVVELVLGRGVTGASCTVSSGATWGFDPKARRLRWEIQKAPQGASYSLRGTFSATEKPSPARAFQISFDISQNTFSGLKVDQLRVQNEGYKPYKGVRGKSIGDVEWRW
ncbi:clathrin adaptor, mu subunit [Schizopora paradoxa]|uniref:Clathrin adaptor, mu subunit n=1 Tax=Schizopora paradoxa TaxID=27342 RepID=A0A0H2RXP0_9AGAM|nr:clathrin adaptor, mu subunit [Schizopora paradoxa]